MQLIINKKSKVNGSVRISGAKNAAMPIICACLLNKAVYKLYNIPNIKDIKILIKVINRLGVKSRFKKNRLYLNTYNIRYEKLLYEELKEIRGSYYLIPIFLKLFGYVEIYKPGGCAIGKRPIDATVDIYKALGYSVDEDIDIIRIKKNKSDDSFKYRMIKKSVGASINAILTSLDFDYAVIDNIVIEPETTDLINFLKYLGYNIEGYANVCTIRGSNIKGNNFKYKIIPDRIEAMTFIILGLLCGRVVVKNGCYQHLRYPLTKLIDNLYHIEIKNNKIIATLSRGSVFDVITDVYPFFPTDMQSLFGVLFSYGRGSCFINEKIFDNRMQIYNDLNNCGKSINLIENKAYIIGDLVCNPINFKALDLRHGAALLLLAIKNTGIVDNICVLERGYDNIFKKLKSVGIKYKLKKKS